MTTSTASVLRAARALIADPEHWGKGAIIRGRFCALIAVHEATRNPRSRRLAVEALELPLNASTLVAFNDAPERTHAEVLALFDRAIKAEEEEA